MPGTINPNVTHLRHPTGSSRFTVEQWQCRATGQRNCVDLAPLPHSSLSVKSEEDSPFTGRLGEDPKKTWTDYNAAWVDPQHKGLVLYVT